jgi:hypothetical protein
VNAGPPTAPIDPRGPQPPELGLGSVYRAPADYLADRAAEAAAAVTLGESVVIEPPRWRLGRTPLWTARLSLRAQRLVRLLVMILTFGLIRLDTPKPGADPGEWTLRQQLLLARLPVLRREIRAIRQRRRPIIHRTLTHEVGQLARLRSALWWSGPAIRIRQRILWLQMQIVVVWLWVNREAILFYGMVIVIVFALLGMILLIQQQQGVILDFMDSLRPSIQRSIPSGPDPMFGGDD